MADPIQSKGRTESLDSDDSRNRSQRQNYNNRFSTLIPKDKAENRLKKFPT